MPSTAIGAAGVPSVILDVLHLALGRHRATSRSALPALPASWRRDGWSRNVLWSAAAAATAATDAGEDDDKEENTETTGQADD